MATINRYFTPSALPGQTVEDGSPGQPWICDTWQAFQDKVVTKYSASLTYEGNPYTQADTLVLNFYPGSYQVDKFELGYNTGAEWLPDRFIIKRHDPNLTGQKPKFTLKANASLPQKPDGTYEAFRYVIYTGGYPRYCHLSDIIVDCNGFAQSTYIDLSGHRKVGGISLKRMDSSVDRCEVFNFLAKTEPGDTEGAEVFPLVLTGLNDAAHRLVNLSIRDCYVHDLIAINTGYCTAIMIETFSPAYLDQDDIYDDSKSSSSSEPYYMCFAEDNDVRCVFPGIGLGGRFLQRAVFRRNRVSKAYAGFNVDTLRYDDNTPRNSRIVTIEDNEFEDVDNGVTVGATNEGTTTLVASWWIRNNSFILRGLCPLGSSSSSADTTSLVYRGELICGG